MAFMKFASCRFILHSSYESGSDVPVLDLADDCNPVGCDLSDGMGGVGFDTFDYFYNGVLHARRLTPADLFGCACARSAVEYNEDGHKYETLRDDLLPTTTNEVFRCKDEAHGSVLLNVLVASYAFAGTRHPSP